MKREDVEKRAAAAIDELASALEQGKSDTLVAYLDMLSRFHRYSFGNCMLIAMQRPDATNVAGFRRWKTLGRFVKKGESGIAILAPLVRRRTDEVENDDGDTAATAARSVMGYRVVYVFDVSQTEGKPLAEFAQISGDPGDKLERLEKLVRSHGIELAYESIAGGALGVSAGGRIMVAADLPSAESFSVVVHELAHELLHRGERRKETTKTIRETEAEAVAFVVCRASGLETSTRSSDYIQLYAGDKELLMDSLGHVQRVSSEILSALEETLSDGKIANAVALA